MNVRRRRFNVSKLLLLILLVLLIVNFKQIVKTIYPMPYADAIYKYSERANVDPFLMTAIMKAESSFRPDAVSAKGARGLMQIMPDTGQWIAQQINLTPFHPDLLFDPETNIRLGAWYIANLEDEFKKNKIMVLAAYNGGRGNVNKWLEEEKITGSIKDIKIIPFPETKDFVTRVLWNYKVYQWLYSK